MIKDELSLIIIAGPEGSGRHTFYTSYKHSFGQSLPIMTLYQGIVARMSFVSILSLSNEDDLLLIKRAREEGYRITIYFLVLSCVLSLCRLRIKKIAEGYTFSEKDFRERYETSYKGLVNAFTYANLVFVIKNQKIFEFCAAFDVNNTNLSTFSKSIKSIRAQVEAFK